MLFPVKEWQQQRILYVSVSVRFLYTSPGEKDFDSHLSTCREWYQIVECCHYLSAQVQQNTTNIKAATVTLLTGEKQSPSTTFSHSGLAQAAGMFTLVHLRRHCV